MDHNWTGRTPLKNWTLPQNFTRVPEYGPTMRGIELFLIPLMAVFGISGNAFSCAIFSSKPLKKYSSSFLLTCKNLSDIGLLVTLFLIWAFSVFDLHFHQIFPACQISIFLTYVFGCLSSWLVTRVTMETYIRLCKPLYVKRICRKRKAKFITACMTLAIVCGYCFPFWTVGQNCVPKDYYRELITIMVYVEAALTMFVPSAIMMLACIAVFVSYIKSCERSRKLSSTSTTSYARVKQATTMLFLVTVTFVLLNLPLHVSRIRLVYLHSMDTTNISLTESTFQTISLFLCYLSRAINFVIYNTFGSRFRSCVNEEMKRKGGDNTAALRINRRPSIPPLVVKRKVRTFALASDKRNNCANANFHGLRQAKDV